MRSIKLNFSATALTLGLKAKMFEMFLAGTVHAPHVWPLCGARVSSAHVSFASLTASSTPFTRER